VITVETSASSALQLLLLMLSTRHAVWPKCFDCWVRHQCECLTCWSSAMVICLYFVERCNLLYWWHLTSFNICWYFMYMCRSFLSGTGGLSQWPDASRLVEAICVRLCQLHPAAMSSQGVRVHEPRQNSILTEYSHLREMVVLNR